LPYQDQVCLICNGRQIGDLLKDWRRVNVSFTRARSKLIIFGSRKTLCAAPILAEFLDLMETKGWIISLGCQADSIHARDPGSVAVQPKRRVVDEAEPPGKENAHFIRKTKKVKVDKGVLKGRPMLQDVVNDLS
jgi:DNA replication ATP-dependent helicase/nuclease Dna2